MNRIIKQALIIARIAPYGRKIRNRFPGFFPWPTNITFRLSTPGAGFAGGAVPIRGGVILHFLRMNRILDIRIANRLVVVQPGVVYGDPMKALALPVMLCVERFLLIMFSQSKYLRSFVCKWRQGLAHVFFS